MTHAFRIVFEDLIAPFRSDRCLEDVYVVFAIRLGRFINLPKTRLWN
jgi:hypothetical protein